MWQEMLLRTQDPLLLFWEHSNIEWHDSSLSLPHADAFPCWIPAAEHMQLTTIGHIERLYPCHMTYRLFPPTTTWHHATSRAPVECQISITILFPLQSPSCFSQPWSQCPLWSGEDGSGNHSTVANHEWGHWNQPRTCWGVSGFVALSKCEVQFQLDD